MKSPTLIISEKFNKRNFTADFGFYIAKGTEGKICSAVVNLANLALFYGKTIKFS